MSIKGIKAVAEEAGVSISTVSKALSRNPQFARKISEATRRKILACAKGNAAAAALPDS